MLLQPIETPRLLLREFVRSDWPDMLKALSPESMEYFDAEPARTDDDAKKWVDNAVAKQREDPRTWYAFAVQLKGGAVIGYCDLVIRQPIECRMAYSGYCYAPEYWRQGYGTEAELAILDYGFTTLGLTRVSCIAQPENVGSWRIMEKSGMRREGHEILGDWSSTKRKRIDRLLYAILDEEWREAKHGAASPGDILGTDGDDSDDAAQEAPQSP